MIEIKPIKNLDAIIQIPGSKSYTHRALIISSLADGESTLLNPLKSEDTYYTSDALKKFGIPILWSDDNKAYIYGSGGRLLPPRERVYVGNSGTSMRFLTAMSSLIKGKVLLEGNYRMKKRPMIGLIECLKTLGVDAYALEDENSLLVCVESNGLKGGYTQAEGKESSQFISALLMIAPYSQKGIEIEVKGEPISKPYLDITIDTMSSFGINVLREGYKYFSVPSGVFYKPQKYWIEADASNASYFFSAAAITCGKVRVEKINPYSLQGDIRFLNILEEMGCNVIRGANWVEIRGKELRGIEIDMSDTPDLVPTLAVTASFAQGKTTIKNIGHLRFKESDRIEALTNELKKMGIRVLSGQDWLTIEGGSPKGIEIETYNDHRIAMSFAIAGLKVSGVKITREDCVNKSFPQFWEKLKTLYAEY